MTLLQITLWRPKAAAGMQWPSLTMGVFPHWNKSVQAVNDWVSEATRGKITDVVNDEIVKQVGLGVKIFRAVWVV